MSADICWQVQSTRGDYQVPHTCAAVPNLVMSAPTPNAALVACTSQTGNDLCSEVAWPCMFLLHPSSYGSESLSEQAGVMLCSLANPEKPAGLHAFGAGLATQSCHWLCKGMHCTDDMCSTAAGLFLTNFICIRGVLG